MEEPKGHLLRDILESVAIAVVLALIIKMFLFQNFAIPSGSMEPTLHPGDMIYVNKIQYKLGEPKRFDIIVFKYPVDPKRDFVKRLVGLPGDTVQVKNMTLIVNNRPVEEPFVKKDFAFPDFGPVKVPAGSYFMMGDNRANSSDSRVWGTVPRGNIIGKAMFKYWPPERVGILR